MILIGYKIDNISQEKNVINQKYSLEIDVSKNASDLWSILYTKKSDIFGYLQQSPHSFVSWSHFFPNGMWNTGKN